MLWSQKSYSCDYTAETIVSATDKTEVISSVLLVDDHRTILNHATTTTQTATFHQSLVTHSRAKVTLMQLQIHFLPEPAALLIMQNVFIIKSLPTQHTICLTNTKQQLTTKWTQVLQNR